MVNSSGQVQILFSDQVQNTEESPEEYHQFCATMKKEIVIQTRRRQRRKLTIQLSPNLSLNLATMISNGLWFIIAILFVQFNLYVVPVQGRPPPLPMTEAMETYQDDPEEIQMTHDCSEFCQDPPESSGRWECPDIR